jgi:hypothetical protein
MALSQIGNAAGKAAHDAGPSRQREPFVPHPAAPPTASPARPAVDGPPVTPPAVARTLAARAQVARPVEPSGATADLLLDAIRRSLAPGDPVARLLATWPAPAVRAVAVTRRTRHAERA